MQVFPGIDLRAHWYGGGVASSPRAFLPVAPANAQASGLPSRVLRAARRSEAEWLFAHKASERRASILEPQNHKTLVLVFHGFLKNGQQAMSMPSGFVWLMNLLSPELRETHQLVPVSWPADPMPGGKVGDALAIHHIDAIAREAGRKLATTLQADLRGRRLSVVAQSLGNRVALEFLHRLHKRKTPITLEAVISTGAAVENCVFSEKNLYADSTKKARSIHVLHSHNDWVLRGLYGAGAKRQIRLFATMTRQRRVRWLASPPALGRSGPTDQSYFDREKRPNLYDDDLRRAKHAGYMPQKLIYEHWRNEKILCDHLIERIDREGDKTAMQWVRTAWRTAQTLATGSPGGDELKTKDQVLELLEMTAERIAEGLSPNDAV
ncbi:MAG: hypothetical protein ACI9VR_000539 [Cognaticolwellia sp.]